MRPSHTLCHRPRRTPHLRGWVTQALAAALFVPLLAQAQIPGLEDPDAKPPNCLVSEFRSLALSTSELKRAQQARAWILEKGKHCSLDRLVTLRNNRNQWLGHADSAELAGEIDRLIELAAKDEPEVIKGLYTSPAPPAQPKAE
jgi:hypothetical protein